MPSATFVGAAAGYVFKLGPKGLGYYLDTASGIACTVQSAAALYIAPVLCFKQVARRNSNGIHS